MCREKDYGIVDTVTEDRFIREFKGSAYKDNFSDKGLRALYEHLNEFADECEHNIEMDVVSIACEYNEYDSFKEFQEDYSGTLSEEVESWDDVWIDYFQAFQVDGDSYIIRVQ